MLSYFGALDRAAVLPLAPLPAPAALSPDELRAAALDEYDTAVTDLDRALIAANAARAALDDCERVLLVMQHRVTLARAAVQGQQSFALEGASR